MLSKTATYWLAGIGVVGVAAVTPVILKHYHVWPGAADAPATLLSPNMTATRMTPPPSAAAAPAASTPAPATVAPTTPAPAQAASEPKRSETASAQPTATPDSAAPTAVASNKTAPSEQPAAAPSAPAAAATPAPPGLKPPASPPAQASAQALLSKSDPQRPAFDVVRVEPTGDAVIAGRASPRSAVQLRSDGRVVAQVDADESGQFAILPPPFPAGGHRLQLAARSGGASEVLSDAIGIEVPATSEAAAPSAPPAPQASAPSPAPAKPAATAAPPPPKPAETARSEAPAPLKAAPSDAAKAKPPEPAKVAKLDTPPASPQPAAVSILSVEMSGTGRFVAKGAAEPNTIVRLYLNNAYLADAIAGADGRWSLTVERGMTSGAYTIRADEIDRANGAVVARAEVPFNYPDRPATQVAAATPGRALSPTLETAPAKPMQDQAAPSGTPTAAQAPRPAAQEAGASAASPAPQPQAMSAPQAAEPVAKNEAPQTSTSPPATTSEQPKANGTDVPAKNSSAPAPSAAPTEATANPPLTSSPTPAAAESPAVAAAEPTKPADSAHPVIADIRTTKVVRGDNLWNLSKHFYGYGPEYQIIYEANASQIRNPRLIYPDQIFVVPRNPTQ